MSNQQHKLEQCIPDTWINRWEKEAPVSLPTSWTDPEGIYPHISRQADIETKNRRSLMKALKPIIDISDK
jgi:acetoin utilization protein AcuC